MSTHKQIDRICCCVLVFVLVLTIIFMNAGKLGVQAVAHVMGYESALFDTSMVHTIDIEMEDWDAFLADCMNEEYAACSLVIDQTVCKNAAIRAKGNTSLTSVASYGNNRYSFKVEFDHYDQGNTYYGLDKLCLNNIIQDNTFMKDYVTYQMMAGFGADAPLCSFAYITVNGEDFGLYLAVEGVEESFLERKFGNDYGELYKPDSMDMGGGRGNGAEFNPEDMEGFMNPPENQEANQNIPQINPEAKGDGMQKMNPEAGGDGMQQTDPEAGGDGMQQTDPEAGGDGTQKMNSEAGGDEMQKMNPEVGEGGTQQKNGNPSGPDAPGGMSRGSDDVSLIYTDDEYESYGNIFDNAKTEITDRDKDRLIASLKLLNEGDDIEHVVNVEEVIRYFVVHNFVCNFDSYTGSMIHNYYLYEKEGQLSMIPWDYNLAFGGFESGTDAQGLVNYPIDSPVSGGTIESRPMLAWIFASEEYTEQYHQYFAEFIEQYFVNGECENMIDTVSEMIAPYVEKDPTKFCSYEEFLEGVSTLKLFCALRAESIQGQLDGSISSTDSGVAVSSREEQTSDSDVVEAANLSIEAMGTMGNGFGRGGGPGNTLFEAEDFPGTRGSMSEELPEEAEPVSGELPEETESVSGELPEEAEPVSGELPEEAVSVSGELPEETESVSGELPEEAEPMSGEIPGELGAIPGEMQGRPPEEADPMSGEIPGELGAMPGEMQGGPPGEAGPMSGEMPRESGEMYREMPGEPGGMPVEMAGKSGEMSGKTGESGVISGETPEENQQVSGNFSGETVPMLGNFPEKTESMTEASNDRRTMSQPPDMRREDNGNLWLLTGISTAVLLAGVLYACRYKRYV